MNSVHDIGGTDGFGQVRQEVNEPVFHAPWEGRVFGMALLRAGDPNQPNIDTSRHRLELLPPGQYINSTYYQRWLARLENAAVGAGTLTREEIDAKVAEFVADPNLSLPRLENPKLTDEIAAMLRAGIPVTRKIANGPRFAVGDKVVTRNLNPHGHTRMPRYTRNKKGMIVARHGAHVFPDTNAHGLGENPQHLYTVRISAQELWGDAAEPKESVMIDLWESYLAPDGTATQASPAKRAASPKLAKPKKPAKAKAIKARRTITKVAPKPKTTRAKAKPARKKSR